jgi:purine-nucleoside phosphorylase
MMNSSNMSLYQQVSETGAWLEEQFDGVPDVGIILGSGLGILTEEATNTANIPYREIPHFPVSRVEGHAGQLVKGDIGDTSVLMMQGRVHYYEGWSMERLTLPVRAMEEAGVSRLLVTNSAGGINPEFDTGDLMIIRDHINFMGDNPLRGPNDERLGPRFPDMTQAYSLEMIDEIREAAREEDVWMQEGVYIGMAGPSYETPSEIQMAQRLGADAVGMSTVPEVIAANHQGLEVAGISCITNLASGISESKLSHDEVKETASRVRDTFVNLVTTTLGRL